MRKGRLIAVIGFFFPILLSLAPRTKSLVTVLLLVSCASCVYIVDCDILASKRMLWRVAGALLTIGIFCLVGILLWPNASVEIKARVALVASNSLPSCLVVGAQLPKPGKVIAAIPYLINFQVSNSADSGLDIESYTVEIADSHSGPWLLLQPVVDEEFESEIYFTGGNQIPISTPPSQVVVPRLEFPSGTYKISGCDKNAVQAGTHILMGENLDTVLSQGIKPHSSVRAWQAFAFDAAIQELPNEFVRVTIHFVNSTSFIDTVRLPKREKKSNHEVDPALLPIMSYSEELGVRTPVPYGYIREYQ